MRHVRTLALSLVGALVGGCGTGEVEDVAVARDTGALGLCPAQAHGVDATASASSARASHTISYDEYSLMIDGRRTFIWSGEFEYWRLPSPDLWLDILQKLKAEAYNTVTVYFNWAYHSPKPGVYDFSGVRNLDRLLDLATRTGLYVIARPGPYINAETSAGGYPGWLTTQAGKARTDAPDYLAASDEWLTHVDTILRRHQLTNGTGTVILYQIENELAATSPAQLTYLNHLSAKVRSDGISVPIFHNDKGRHGYWVPASSQVPGTITGPVDLYAFDGYPGGSCHTDATPGSPSVAPDWGIWGAGGATGGSSASPSTPGFTAEFGGGWFDYWGSQGTYDCTAIREGPGYERVFYGTNIANRLAIQNFYMAFGGTSWGWLPAPVVYTSYDYGAAISEARQLRPKATTMKELGLFLQSVDPITMVDKGDPVVPSSAAIKVYHDVNPDTGTHFYIAMHNPSNATTNDSFTFPITTSDGNYTVPQQGTLAINGQDATVLVADYAMDDQHLVYSTSEIMTHFTQGTRDIALLYGRAGSTGETMLRYPTRPTVRVLAGQVTSRYDGATGDLRLNYTHSGLIEVRISGGSCSDLDLLLTDETIAGTFWRQDTPAGPVLEQGPALVRTAQIVSTPRDHGWWGGQAPGCLATTLRLAGDTRTATALRVWAPPHVAQVIWNGTLVPTVRDAGGSLVARRHLAGPSAVTLPDLSRATWRVAAGSPESQPSFDDSAWVTADRTSTNSTTQPPAGQVVLTADDYGFHQGDVWYRACYSGADAATSLTMRYGGGGAGLLQAWLDGVYLGQDVLATGVKSPPTTGTVTFALPFALRSDGPHTLAVMIRNGGHNEDGGVNDAHKEGRGLIAATLTDASSARVDAKVAWKIQGNLGGEDLADPVRGVANSGGLFGERHGWSLPGYPDCAWRRATVPATTAMSGTSWYRTTFDLHLPEVDDASIGLTIGDLAASRSTADYRAIIFVNGWNMGQYIANVGPQHTFVIPNGVLDTRGRNTLAIAVTSDGGPGNGLENVLLMDLGTVRGGVPVSVVRSPRWNAATWGSPAIPDVVAMEGFTGNAASPAHGGDTFDVTGTLADLAGPGAWDVTVTLDVPAGWTATPSGPTAIGPLAPDASRTLDWTVTIPDDAAQGSYAVAAIVSYWQGTTHRQTGAAYQVLVVPKGLVYISDLPWVSAVSGWHSVLRDQNVNVGPLSINGVPYAKGIGTNSVSTVVINVPTECTAFSSDVGVDDAAGTRGSVTFAVLVDGTEVASTGVMHGGEAAQHLTADVTAATRLTLEVGDAGDGIGHDNGDWGDAQLDCAD